MIFDVAGEKTHLQYLIFYESLDDYKKAFDIYKEV
jgi:hypothetical protein